MIELKGIIQYLDHGKKYVDIVVTRDHPDMYERHRVGTDVKVNRGQIEKALHSLGGPKAERIVWPHHIKAKDI